MFGISWEEFEYLKSPEALELINREIESDPAKLALQGIAPAVCNQIKYLSRCRTKLPHLYHSRAIIPPLSYEQASSYHTASIRTYSGDTLLDLTCGLGVDSYFLSKQFNRVITLEQDSLIAAIAEENFRRLGATNIEVINTKSEDYINNNPNLHFDTIYIDPARREHNKKVFLLEDCSPNVIELLPLLKRMTDRIVIKLSPMFDHSEAQRIFGSNCSVYAVSLAGECKELIVEIYSKNSSNCGTIGCNIIERNGTLHQIRFNKQQLAQQHNGQMFDIENYKYITIADVAIRKMRCAEPFYCNYHTEENYYFTNELALWLTAPTSYAGKLYEIESAMPYKPKQFRSLKISNATIITHNFPYSSEQIQKALKIKSGSSKLLILTTMKGEPFIFTVKPINY